MEYQQNSAGARLWKPLRTTQPHKVASSRWLSAHNFFAEYTVASEEDEDEDE
jgi:hypothetical protein